MIRVVQVLEATTGGTRRHLRDLLCGLDRARFNQHLIYADRRDSAFVTGDLPLFRAGGIGLHRVPMRRRPAPFSDGAAVLRMVLAFRRLKPDIVHAHSAKAGMTARVAARLAGVPRVVYSPHGFAFEMDVDPVRRRAYLGLERLTRRWTDTCVCLCAHERHLARAKVGFADAQLCVIPNGIAPEVMPGGGRERSVHPPATGKPQAAEGLTVGFVGRLCRQKGPDVLASAALSVARAVPGVNFRFVGDGPLRDPLRRRLTAVGETVRWRMEPVADEHAARTAIGEVDVLAMPSRWEALPYVLLDALAVGTPVVASAVGGIPEVLRDGQAGLLTPPEDAAALAAALIRLLGDSALRARLSQAATRRAADFSRDCMLDALTTLYLREGSSSD